ncbi:hypothetical protein FS749_010528 [Ceratobasidium sp. UAMH 11750]|nr:hypothetical protein FS749_010528 [Ceratobasidium sp. UAMH 11750]
MEEQLIDSLRLSKDQIPHFCYKHKQGDLDAPWIGAMRGDFLIRGARAILFSPSASQEDTSTMTAQSGHSASQHSLRILPVFWSRPPRVLDFLLRQFNTSHLAPHVIRERSSTRIEYTCLCLDWPTASAAIAAITPTMPADDPVDQQATRALESSLREAVKRFERPPVELEWFTALPKRIRRSARLIEAAQNESRVLLEHIRAEWTKSRRAEREHEERLNRAKAIPRDLNCLRAPDPHAWNGLGRRKKRCRKDEAIGRAFTARQRAVTPAATTPGPVVDIHAVHRALP